MIGSGSDPVVSSDRLGRDEVCQAIRIFRFPDNDLKLPEQFCFREFLFSDQKPETMRLLS